jgi:hypothetical protein
LIAAWRSRASGPQLVGEVPTRRGPRKTRPLHHQAGLNPARGSPLVDRQRRRGRSRCPLGTILQSRPRSRFGQTRECSPFRVASPGAYRWRSVSVTVSLRGTPVSHPIVLVNLPK